MHNQICYITNINLKITIDFSCLKKNIFFTILTQIMILSNFNNLINLMLFICTSNVPYFNDNIFQKKYVVGIVTNVKMKNFAVVDYINLWTLKHHSFN